MLTAAERKRLAKEARTLAMECVEGGPEMDSTSWCGCAIGTALKRARLLPRRGLKRNTLCGWAERLLEPERASMLSNATTHRVSLGNPTAVVFPLLALATALDGKVL